MLHYLPESVGGWLLVAVDDALLYLRVTSPPVELPTMEGKDPEGSDDAVAGYFAALRSPDPIRCVLDILTRGGLSATPEFALAQWSPESLHVLVRGAAVVTVESPSGSERLDGSTVSTWRETTVAHVRELRVGWGSPAPAVPPATQLRLPLEVGAAWATAVTVTVESPATAAPATAVPDAITENTIAELVESGAVTNALPTAPTPAPIGDDDAYSHLFEQTVVRSIEEAAVRPSDDDGTAGDGASDSSSAVADAAAVADADADTDSTEGDHDGETIMSGDIAALLGSRRRGRASDGDPAETDDSRNSSDDASAPAPRVIYLELSTGGRERLTQPILVGRSPSVSKVSSDHVPRLVTIAGDQDISRNHARFALEGDTVVVTDLHSRNGTSVILPGKTPQRLRQGEPTAILIGAVVDLGGGVTLTVGEEE